MSSIAAYGPGLAHRESDPLAPEGAPNPYVDHKASAERALLNVAHLEPMTQRTFVEALARIAGIEPTPLETALRAGFAWYWHSQGERATTRSRMA